MMLDDLRKPETWERIADALADKDYSYDLSDSSERLDIVQIVCEAIFRVMSDDMYKGEPY